MKKQILFCVALVVSCQAGDKSELTTEPAAVLETPAEAIALDGTVTLVVGDLASEPRACIVPIRVENGTEGDVNVTMIGFSVTGPGEDSTGNMFAPVATSGTASEARVILEGQSCDAYDMIRVPEVLCKADGEDCSDKIEFEGSDALNISQAG